MKKIALLLLVMAAAGCSGDATGARRSLAGEWIYRTRISTLDTWPVGCRVTGTVRLTGSGNSFSGRMPVPEASCSGPYAGHAPVFDSTTTLTAQVQGDSVLLTLRANGGEIRQTARILGDSLTGVVSGDGSSGTMAARRYPDDVEIDRVTVRVSGALTRTVELHGRGAWNGLLFRSAANDEALSLLPTTQSVPVLTVGTYAVGNTVAVPLSGYYTHWAGNVVDIDVELVGGTVTIVHADAQLVRGSFDLIGRPYATSDQVRLQGDFVSHASGYPGGG